jgi:Surfeit locus protein 5 subunit 22 of Mediator complex
MQVETAALIRAAEDLTALTRRLKELWLFGQLNTLGPSAVDGRVEAKAREVAELMENVLRPGEVHTENQKVDEEMSGEAAKE